ncbi:unnamed protein product [Thelazia callipaeda]|uniref:BRCA1-associated protein n=1 Tax=Thelazia callipaeda TaxID=103827 RepID=A0A0N5D4I4_THECL|nr:unnamed protein product [Thelazia callipaeda]
MSERSPLIIRLEIQSGAPDIKFQFTASHKEKSVIVPAKKFIQEKNKQEKAIVRVKMDGDFLPPVAVHKGTNQVEAKPTQAQCLGNREYSEVVVQTFVENKTLLDGQGSVMKDGASSVVSSVAASYSKAIVEKSATAMSDCSILCMLAVPSLISCRELLKFIAPSSQYINAMKVIRDSTPNQYMVIINFRSHDAAVRFYDEYNGITYNEIEPEECSLIFVERIEMVREEAGGSLPSENMIELPTCAVCLERMDDSVLTILCNHTFHAGCLEQWADTTCPVCRQSQTPELVADQKCSDCGKTTDLWICLICGNIGCGRYVEAHAYRHFEATSHTFTLEVGGERVWDYAGDNYVHRLIQSSPDGKVVEYKRSAACDSGVCDSGESAGEKLESIQLEYTCLLASQLEYQRVFYENKMNEQERLFSTLEKVNNAQVETLEKELLKMQEECEELKKTLTSCSQQRRMLEKKHRATLTELEEERALNVVLRSDQEKWLSKFKQIEARNESLEQKYSDTVKDLNEQIRDLMMHFETGAQIQSAVQRNEITEKEITESSVVVGDAPQQSQSKKRRHKKK